MCFVQWLFYIKETHLRGKGQVDPGLLILTLDEERKKESVSVYILPAEELIETGTSSLFKGPKCK